MKKVTGKTKDSLPVYVWAFTQQEGDELEAVLSKFQPDKVEIFLSELESMCGAARLFLQERDITFTRKEKERMVRRFTKAKEDLFQLVDRKIKTRESKSVLEFGIDSGEITNPGLRGLHRRRIFEYQRLHWLMYTAAIKLDEILRIIKAEASNPGRPKAEDAVGDFVTLIARCFDQHLKRPTAYNDGPFCSVVRIALQAVGLPSEYPSRHIKVALRNL
jgi:hypothetical protein